jgi:hypothetical protein
MCRGDAAMSDLLMLSLVIGGFALMVLYVRACDRI